MNYIMSNFSRPIPILNKFLLSLYCFSFVFDFKGVDGGGYYHVFMLLLCFFAGCAFVLLNITHIKKCDIGSKSFSLFVWWTFFIFLSFFPYLYYQINNLHYLKVLLPFVLFWMSLAVAVVINIKGYDPCYILKILYGSSVVSMAWTFIYAVFVNGVSMDVARYQIVGPGVLFVVSYTFSSLIIKRSLGLVDFLLLIVAVSIIMFSFTRSLLLVYPFMFIVYFFWSGGLLKVSKFFQVLRTVFPLLFLLFVVLISVALINPDVFNAWYVRLLSVGGEGYDITFITRIAEYSFQWKMLISEWFSVFFGRGLGSGYSFDDKYFDILSQVFSQEYLLDTERWFAGHSFWVYSVYSSGLVFGLIPIFVFLAAIYSSYRKSLPNENSLNYCIVSNLVYRAHSIVFFSLIAYLSQSFTGNPMGGRFSALTFGLLIGLAFYDKKIHNYYCSIDTRD